MPNSAWPRIGRTLSALLALMIVLGAVPRPAEAVAFIDFVGGDRFRLSVEILPDATPTTVTPRFSTIYTNTGTVNPGIATFPIGTAQLFFDDLVFSTVVSKTLSIGPGAVGLPGIGDVSDLFQLTTTFAGTDGSVITATIQVTDPTLQLINNVITKTVTIGSGVITDTTTTNVDLTYGEPITDTILLNQALDTGGGFYLVNRNGNVITATLTAIVDRTREVISEPSSLLLAMAGFATLAVFGRLIRLTGKRAL